MESIQFIQDFAVVMVVAGAVGWVCQRFGLSSVVGYLLAGIVIGPHTPPFALVSDVDRIETLSNMGLVFLMFGIGMGLSIRRLRNMGAPILVATGLTALLVFLGCRFAGMAAGWSETQTLFFAAMLMVSSSAIISKVLQELDQIHQRPGQLALGMTVLEDIVAVVMLAVLSSLVALETGESSANGSIGEQLGMLGIFVLCLLVVGLLTVPRFLRGLDRSASGEIQAVLMVGLLLSLSVLAVKAGYSLALGAFLLGAIVAETPQKAQMDRFFEGLRHVFSAMFFVAIGMLIVVKELADVWPWIVGGTIFTLLLRSFAATFAMVATGNRLTDAVRTALFVIPLGEFSFIIAQLGVDAGAVPPWFYGLAVGMSLGTAFLAPILGRMSGPIATWIERHEPPMLRAVIAFHHRSLEHLHIFRSGSMLWKVARKRIIQVVVELLLITGLIFFSDNGYDWIERHLSSDFLFRNGLAILYWSVLGLVLLAPLLAVWRNIGALAMIFSEALTANKAPGSVLRLAIEYGLRGLAGVLLMLWLAACLPFERLALWVAGSILLLLAVAMIVFWRRWIRIHSGLEVELQQALGSGHGADGRGEMALASDGWFPKNEDWDVNIAEIVVPDHSAVLGRSLRELNFRQRFGCSIVAIDRQGYPLGNPGPDAVLYPGDKLLMLGSSKEVDAAEALVVAPASEEVAVADFAELQMETLDLPLESPLFDRPLLDLGIGQLTGVQLAGIRREGVARMAPGGEERLKRGDQLLVLGTPPQILRFQELLVTGTIGKKKEE